jgi:hypothetical protein
MPTAASTKAKQSEEEFAKQSEQFESAQRELADAAQSQFVAAVKAQQKMALDAAKIWAEQVGKIYPKVPETYANQLREQARKTSEVYEELLAAHKEFTDTLLDVFAPADAD